MLDTLVNVKARLGITTTDFDAFLTAQIQLVSDVIESYCRRRFKSSSYKQTFYREDVQPSVHMELFHFPVSSITSILVDTVAMDAANYRLNPPTGMVRALNGLWFGGWGSLKTEVTYVAGFASVPTPILAVLDDVVQGRYNKQSTGTALNFGSDVQGITIPGAISIQFDYSLQNNLRTSAYGTILGSNANVLDSWRSERAVIGSGKLEYIEAL